METMVIRIFEQHLDFLSADAVMQLAQQFADQFGNLYSRPSLEDVPPEELSNSRLDLRYPDEAISNAVLMLLDSLVRVVSPPSNDV